MKFKPEWSQRLLRKGALVSETYELFSGWNDELSVADNLKAISGRHPTSGWEREVRATLHRRLRHIDRMRPLIALAKRGMALPDWRDCLRLWMGATEEPFHDFAAEWLFAEHEKGRLQLRTDDLATYAEKMAKNDSPKRKPISEYGKLRAARDLLRMSADLAMLTGNGPVKTFASISMSDDVTVFYAHMIADFEGSSAKMPSSRLWRLAFMSPPDVHVALLRLHQFKRLSYEVAGNIVQVGLPFASALECAERVAA
jgi:hypothetical protein